MAELQFSDPWMWPPANLHKDLTIPTACLWPKNAKLKRVYFKNFQRAVAGEVGDSECPPADAFTHCQEWCPTCSLACGLTDLPCAKDFRVLRFFYCITVRQLWSSRWEHSDAAQLCLLLQQLLYVPGRPQNKTKSSCAASPWVTKHIPPGKKMAASVDYVN